LIEDDLGHAVAVAQVDEDQPAVIAPPVDPAIELDGLAGIARAQRATGKSFSQRVVPFQACPELVEGHP
jgi:hypothetical protein